MNIVIPMAGLGSRLPSSVYGTIKPLIPIQGIPMINLVIESLDLNGRHIFIYREDQYANQLKEVLERTSKQIELIQIKELTQGPADTCLSATELINNDEELVIANADQIMWWKSDPFLNAARTECLDGAVVTYTSTAQRNSYARLNREGYVKEIREKEVISSIALSGIHYWRRGKDFVSSARQMMIDGRYEHGEFYVGPTYNYLIANGSRIGVYHIPEYQHNPVGVPEDLERYKEKLCKHTE